MPSETKEKWYLCMVCGYIYDPAVGDPSQDVMPGTSFAELDDEWLCPECFVGKSEFAEFDGVPGI